MMFQSSTKGMSKHTVRKVCVKRTDTIFYKNLKCSGRIFLPIESELKSGRTMSSESMFESNMSSMEYEESAMKSPAINSQNTQLGLVDKTNLMKVSSSKSYQVPSCNGNNASKAHFNFDYVVGVFNYLNVK